MSGAGRWHIEQGDCLDVLRRYTGPLFQLVITDPPGAKGMAEWDGDRGGRDHWIAWLCERLTALRARTAPGSWSLTWAHPSTTGWTQRALEDAGWCVVDKIPHINAQGRAASKSRIAPGHEDWWLAYNPGAKPRELNLELPVVAPKVRRRAIRNVILGEGSRALLELDALSAPSGSYSGKRNADKRHTYRAFNGTEAGKLVEGDEGAASRFFPRLGEGDLSVYAPKARFHERQLPNGLESQHPTAKSPTLIAWFYRLLNPVDGALAADIFCGSGVIGEVAAALGLRFFGCDNDPKWVAESQTRLRAYDEGGP